MITALTTRINWKGLIVLFVFWTGTVQGQISITPAINVPVKDHGGSVLHHAWSGGLNAPQFSEMDLNFDGHKDLVVFEREGNKIVPFVNNGTPNTVDYTYAPIYANNFPNLYYWALMVDYNGDGLEDIFTSSQEGVMVYKNTSSSSSGISFQALPFPFLESYADAVTKVKIEVSSQDIPAISDIDGDGDLDILAFGSGSTALIYHENLSADSGNPELFRFQINTYCWGKFEESPTSNKVTLNKKCPKSGSSGNHVGGTLLAFDPDGDNDKDLLLGDMFYSNMVFLTNGGTTSVANMTAQDTTYPPGTDEINVNVFPAAYYLDVTNDGLKDLLVAPNFQNNMENKTGVQFYKNVGSIGSASFQIQPQGFLQQGMIEFGTGAYPAALDYNFDYVTDLVVGNFGLFDGVNQPISRLEILENGFNSGTLQFHIADNDYGGLSTIPLNTGLNIPTLNLVPTFGDLNGDGYLDMLVGDYEGRLHYFVNKPANAQCNFELEEPDFEGIDVGRYASPQLYDFDRDGLLELIVGEQDGNLNYYENTGTASNPSYNLVSEEFGMVSTSEFPGFPGYSQPHFFRTANGTMLLCGMESGKVRFYDNIDGNLNGSFSLQDSALGKIDAGRRSHVLTVDFDNDGLLELIVGNLAGGLQFFNTSQEVGVRESGPFSQEAFDFNLRQLKNGLISVELGESFKGKGSAQLIIRNAVGQDVQHESIDDELITNLSNHATGIYFFTVYWKGHAKTHKLINHE